MKENRNFQGDLSGDGKPIAAWRGCNEVGRQRVERWYVSDPWQRKVDKNIQMMLACLLILFYLGHDLTNVALAGLDLSMWTRLTSSSNSQTPFWLCLLSAGIRHGLLCSCTSPGIDIIGILRG